MSLRTKILILTLTASAVLVMLMTGFALHFYKSSIEFELNERATKSLVAVNTQFKSYEDNAMSKAVSIGFNGSLIQAYRSEDKISAQKLLKKIATYDWVESCELYDLEGRFFAGATNYSYISSKLAPSFINKNLHGYSTTSYEIVGENLSIVASDSFRDLVEDDSKLGAVVISYKFANEILDQMRTITGSEIAIYLNGDVKYSSVFGKNYQRLSQDKISQNIAAEMKKLETTNAKKTKGSYIVDRKIHGENYKAIYSPLVSESGKQVALVMVAFPIGYVQENLRDFIYSLSYIALGVFASVAFASYVFAKRITQPLQILSDTIRQVEMGNFNVTCAIGGADEVGTLAKAFNLMVGKIRKSIEDLKFLDKQKDEFLSHTSQELKTPLQGIIGIADTMLDGATGPLTNIQEKNLLLMVSSGRRLTSLIDGVLDYEKLRSQTTKLNLKSLSVSHVAELVIAMVRPIAKKKGIDLISDFPIGLPVVSADEDRLQQIFYNIIGYAITLTGKGTIKVAATHFAKILVVSISNDGQGISAERLAGIFEVFHKGPEGGSHKKSSLDLNLSITKKLIELHGGSIHVASKIGSGTVFSFNLHVAETQEVEENFEDIQSSISWTQILSDDDATVGKEVTLPRVESHAGERPKNELSGYNILVVDDEVINQQIIANYLAVEGCDLDFASSGEEALIKLSIKKPNIVLLDVLMPRLSGFDTCIKIREKYSASDLPVLLLTPKNQIIDLAEGFKIGANDFIVKPFSKHEILARLRSHLSHARLVKETIEAEIKVTEARLEELGRVAIYLGDRLATPMMVVQLFAEEFEEFLETTSEKKGSSEIYDQLEKVVKAIEVMKKELGILKQYRGFAPQNSLNQDLFVENMPKPNDGTVKR